MQNMPRKQKRSPKGYTNKHGVKLTAKKKRELQSAISAYNKRIERAGKRLPSDLLPPKYKYSEVVDKFYTKSSITNFIKDLGTYNAKSLQLTTIPSMGEAITKAEYDVIKSRINRENRRRKKLKKLVDRQQEEIGFFKTDNDKLLRQINIFDYKNLERLREGSMRFAEDRLYQRADQWKQRYIDKIDYNIGLAIIAGFDPNGDAIEKMRHIQWYLQSLDNLDDITRAAYASPAMDITITSDEVYLQENIDEIYNAWDEFMNSL